MANSTEFSVDQAMVILRRTPTIIRAFLDGLPGAWALSNEGDGTWSPFQIVGHMVHGERTDWMPRVRMILEQGESRPFEPFDRFAQLKASAGKSLEQLLEEFAHLREDNLAALAALELQPADLTRRGMHPALGTVTLSELVATWAVHDLTHLHQITRVLAHQLRGAVGPWSAYLGVLRCAGHSAP
jgi:DinB family protein